MYHRFCGKKQTRLEMPEVQQSNRSIRRAQLCTRLSKQKISHVEEPDYGMHRGREILGSTKNFSLAFDGGGRDVLVFKL